MSHPPDYLGKPIWAPTDVLGFERRFREYSIERDTAEAKALAGLRGEPLAAVERRHEELCTLEALAGLRSARAGASGLEAIRIDALVTACETGIANARLAVLQDTLQSEMQNATLHFDGVDLGLYQALAKVPALDDFAARENLGVAIEECMRQFEPAQIDWHRNYDAVWRDITGEDDPVKRAEARMGIDIASLQLSADQAVASTDFVYQELAKEFLPELLGGNPGVAPHSMQLGYALNLRTMLPAGESADLVGVVKHTLSTAGFNPANRDIAWDVEMRPGKHHRAWMVPIDPPSNIRLQVMPTDGMNAFVNLLHECGHAYHFAGVDPNLPFSVRKLARDYSLTESFAMTFQAVVHDPLWHMRMFRASRDEARRCAQALLFVDLMMFRRYTAKLRYETLFLRSMEDIPARRRDYATLLSAATGLRYSEARAMFDIDDGLYAADYVRAYLNAAQLSSWLDEQAGGPWWLSPESARLLGDIFAGGNALPWSSVAERIGVATLDPAAFVERQKAGADAAV